MSEQPDQDLARRRSERRLRDDLAASPVQAGVLRGYWRIDRLEWPFLYVTVSASQRTTPERALALRIDVSDYPAAPTASPWDLEADCQLPAERRPTGGRATMAFRADWEEGRALYLPVDRVALVGHPDWPRQYARDTWDAERGIVVMLTLVHEILNEGDDEAARKAA